MRMPWRRPQLYLFLTEHHQYKLQRRQRYLFLIEYHQYKRQRRQRYLFLIEYHQHAQQKSKSAFLLDRLRLLRRLPLLPRRVPQVQGLRIHYLPPHEARPSHYDYAWDFLYYDLVPTPLDYVQRLHNGSMRVRTCRDWPSGAICRDRTPGQSRDDYLPRHNHYEENNIVTLDRIPGILQTFQDLGGADASTKLLTSPLPQLLHGAG